MLRTGTDSKVLKQNNVMLKQVEKSLNGLKNGLAKQETLRELDIRHIKASHQVAEYLGERLSDLTGMSMGQHETMMEQLARIQNQVEELKASNARTHENFTSKIPSLDSSRQENAENYIDDDHADNELSESIDRLCGLATKPRTTAFSDEAQQIIADLEKILNLISGQAKSPETYETKKRKQDQLADPEPAETSSYLKRDPNLKKIQGLLMSSPCISVNEKG